jgi:hypothetical protein
MQSKEGRVYGPAFLGYIHSLAAGMGEGWAHQLDCQPFLLSTMPFNQALEKLRRRLSNGSWEL